MSNPFGTNNYGGQTAFFKRNRYKLKDGDNVYRILPAMGDLAAEGRWSVYHNVVFGFKTSEGKHRPFESPEVQNRKTKMIDVPCAASDLINKLKGQLAEAKKAGNKEVAAQLAKIVGDYPVMGVFSLNRDHYMNVVDRQGNVGQLELGHKAKLSLQTEIDRIRNTEGFDPLSPDNGRFFNIRRTGKGLDTLCQVTVVKEKIDVPGVGKVERDLVHAVDAALLERLLVQKGGKWLYKEAANLQELYPTPSSEEVALIVKSADILTGKSFGVDQVFGKTKAVEETTEEPATQESAPAETSAPVTAQAPTAAVTATVAAPTPAPATVTVAQETKAAVKAAETAPAASATKTTAEVVAAMSPDDFMKQMGISL